MINRKKMMKIILIGLCMILIIGCSSYSEIRCYEQIGKDFCKEKNDSYNDMYRDLFTNYPIYFSCVDNNREIRDYNFVLDDKNKCDSGAKK